MNFIFRFMINVVNYVYDKIYRLLFWMVLLQYKLLEQVDEERTKMITKKFLELIHAQEAQ